MNKLLSMASVLAVVGTSSQAATLVAFEGVNGPSVAASVEAAGVTGLDLGRDVGLVENFGGTFNSRSWDEGTDKASALANNNAIFWGLSIDAGMSYDLTSLEIDYDRSGTGPFSIAIDLFIDGVLQSEIFTDLAVANSASQTALVDLSAFADVSGSVFFRLAGWGASTSAGTFDIEDDLAGGFGIIVSGEASVAAVPLPAGLPLLMGSVALLGFMRRRKAA